MLTKEYVRKLFRYDRCTGKLINRINRSFRAREGCEAGSLSYTSKRPHCKYRCVKIDQKTYKVHRIIWLYCHGTIPPEMQIDHKDGDGLNNRMCNLRLVTHIGNARNQKQYRTTISGKMGIDFIESTKRWRVRIGTGGENRHIGCYLSKKDAERARLRAEKEFGYFRNHGRILQGGTYGRC